MSGTGETKAVAKRDTTPLMRRDPLGLASHFARSGYFRDARDVSQAVVKIVFGEELGIGPGASMQGIHIIEGKPSLGANLLGTLVKRSERYDYRPVEISDKVAKIEFLVDGESQGHSEFTIDQAKRAGLVRDKSGWVKYPEAMLFARAMSQGVRWYCPDITAGTPAYTPEELGAEVDESGEPVFVESVGEPAEEVAEAEIVEPIAAEQVKVLEDGIRTLDLSAARVGALLAKCGISGLGEDESLSERLAALSAEEGETLAAELIRLNQDAAAEQPDAAPEEVAADV